MRFEISFFFLLLPPGLYISLVHSDDADFVANFEAHLLCLLSPVICCATFILT